MRTILMILTAVALVVGYTAAPAVADWAPGDGHKMHFPQLPDPTGWDVMATSPIVLADDWGCSQTGWVKDIHFWGSWKGGQDGLLIQFWLRIHRNIPGPPSKPGEVLWEYYADEWQTITISGPWQGWYDPWDQDTIWEDHNWYCQYNIFLDSLDWFWQEQDTIYWLSIMATPLFYEDWGWKTSLDHFMDDATFCLYYDCLWEPLYDPEPPYETIDLAFVITSGEICGDVNGDGVVNLSDPIYLANYKLKGGPPPASDWASDVNCDTLVDLGDALIIAKYFFGIPGFTLNCC